MKRRTTRMGWLVVAAALMAGISACNTADKLQPEETESPAVEAPKTYTLTVTATKGDDDASRALSLNGKTLNATWTAGEVVQVYSVTGEGLMEMESPDPIGTLSAQSSGSTTMLKGEFISTYTPTVGAKLRLRFNDRPDYTNQEGTLEYIATHCDYALAEITVASVDAAGVVTSTGTASFQNQQAIVKFSLKRQDGTTPVEAKSLTVTVGSTTYKVSLAVAASDIFVAVRKASNKAVSLTADGTSGHFTYEKTGVSFSNGKYYAINIKMTRHLSIGDLFFSDGTCGETLQEGKTPIGVIAYLGTDNWTENGVTLRDGTTTLQSHGLVLSLKNAATNSKWGPVFSNEFDSSEKVFSTSDLSRSDHVSGYTYTMSLVHKNADNYPAASACWNFIPEAPANTTGWFLPSAQQWVKMFEWLGEMGEGSIIYRFRCDQSLSALNKWDSAMAKAGSDNYDSMLTSNCWYWSSSECPGFDDSYAVGFAVSDGILFTDRHKTTILSSFPNRVRPVLAF